MTLDVLAVFVAKYLYLLAILAALVYWLRQRRTRQVEIAAVGLVLFPAVVIVARVAALVYVDPRPFAVGHFTPLIPHEPDNGFVSDHALLTSAVATLVLCFQWRLGLLLWVLAVLVGTARVYAGIHHPIDVAGAFAISLLLSPIAYLVAERWLVPPLTARLRRRR